SRAPSVRRSPPARARCPPPAAGCGGGGRRRARPHRPPRPRPPGSGRCAGSGCRCARPAIRSAVPVPARRSPVARRPVSGWPAAPAGAPRWHCGRPVRRSGCARGRGRPPGHRPAAPLRRWRTANVRGRSAPSPVVSARCARPAAPRPTPCLPGHRAVGRYTSAPLRTAIRSMSATPTVPITFQALIQTLNEFWAQQGCVLIQPLDLEVGAGTFHPATFLRALGPEPWNAAYVQPSRRPTDGRYGENPNRLQRYYQYQVVMKPNPDNIQELYLGSLEALGIDPKVHDLRFVEDNWESPTLGAWGLGWEVWLNGMEVTQF